MKTIQERKEIATQISNVMREAVEKVDEILTKANNGGENSANFIEGLGFLNYTFVSVDNEYGETEANVITKSRCTQSDAATAAKHLYKTVFK